MHSTASQLPVPLFILIVYLAGITIFGKGPTYIGFGPFRGIGVIYWGEVVMFFLIAWMTLRIFSHGLPKRLVNPLSLLVLAFMFLGAIVAIPGFLTWGRDAIRDAAIWYYGTFFFIGLLLTAFPEDADRFWKWLGWIWQASLIWNILDMFELAPEALDAFVTSRGFPLLAGSGSENAMHMFLGAVLILIGSGGNKSFFLRKLVSLLVIGVVTGLLFLSHARGVKVAVLAGCMIGGIATFGNRNGLWTTGRLLLFSLSAIWVLALIVAFSDMQKLMQVSALHRFAEANPFDPKGTAYWRAVWWENILHAVHSVNPFFGLGFGQNLGMANPWLVRDLISEWPVRSPHNFNITVLGRMGYVGLFLWLSILASGIGGLFKKVRKGRVGDQFYTIARRKELAFWLVMLVATWLNASFGVLMEGPVLGIWFWFALGFATGRSLGPEGLRRPPYSHEESGGCSL
ncbi:MAG: O-antigen ligase family protein [Deltaproteobacteria bacterium]|nr:O-antigen ligase family protein [Deltaproteobacteria bacterium]